MAIPLEDAMERKKRIEEEVKKTLNILDNLENVEDNPFLFTRIKSKLERAGQTEKYSTKTFVAKWGLILLLFAFNVFTIFNNEFSTYESTTDTQQYLQELGKEYNLYETNYYSYNIE